MEVARGLDGIASGRWERGVTTLGVFDGVHTGHQAVVHRTVSIARERGLVATAITFDRHPHATLRGAPPPQLVPLDERLKLLAGLGTARVLVLAFDSALAAMSALDFARRVLVDTVGARAVVLGHDCRFGRGGEGDAAFLLRHAVALGLAVETVGPVMVSGEVASSSRVRDALARGEIDRARRLLGRPVEVAGTVERGDGRGRMLGFPTANVATPGYHLPAHGVYVARFTADGVGTRDAVANIGTRPTFGASAPRLEVHVLDYAGDLYGARVRVELRARLREERAFRDKDELVHQIAADVARARVAAAERTRS